MNSAVVNRAEIAGHEAPVLENTHVRAAILSALGGRVWTLDGGVFATSTTVHLSALNSTK